MWKNPLLLALGNAVACAFGAWFLGSDLFGGGVGLYFGIAGGIFGFLNRHYSGRSNHPTARGDGKTVRNEGDPGMPLPI